MSILLKYRENIYMVAAMLMLFPVFTVIFADKEISWLSIAPCQAEPFRWLGVTAYCRIYRQRL